jgi:hypothetical protein
MNAFLTILNYAGPQPAPPRTILGRCWRAIVWIITATIFTAVVTVRAALLLAGFTLVIAGLILLTLGGKRSAARKLLEWRERFFDRMRLWIDDIIRPLRRRRIPIASLASQ